MSDFSHSSFFLYLSLILSFFLCFSGCSVYRPGSLEDVSISERVQTKEDSDVSVSVAVLSARGEREAFRCSSRPEGGSSLSGSILKTRANNPLLFLQHFVEPDYFSPQEAAYMSRLKVKRATGTNRVLFFLPDLIFKPFQHLQAKLITRKILDPISTKEVFITHLSSRERLFLALCLRLMMREPKR